MPMVSVIIPLYNKGRTVNRALDSIFAQSFKDYEVVVVDDGSTDNGAGIVNRYKDPRLRLIQQSNAGPGAARNRGVKESSSPYVAFLDADDEWLPEFLRFSVANLCNNPDCVLSVVNHYSGRDKILKTAVPPCNFGIVTGPWRLPPEIEPPEMWGSLIYMQTWAVVCRRDVFLEFGGSYERRCTYLEDHYLWLKILLNCKMYRDTTPYVWYHTEDSELDGPNRRLALPLFPFLSDPEPIRKSCLHSYRLALERFLPFVALINIHVMAGDNTPALKYLLRQFPQVKYLAMKDSIWWFIKLRIKITLPWLVSYVKAAKRLIKGKQQKDN
jgi:glycosyltransferase involved in cell wall biosynthesis